MAGASLLLALCHIAKSHLGQHLRGCEIGWSTTLLLYGGTLLTNRLGLSSRQNFLVHEKAQKAAGQDKASMARAEILRMSFHDAPPS